MNDKPGNQVRIDQTRRDLESLAEEIKAWIVLCGNRDVLKQYQTQLTTLDGFLQKSLSELRSALAGVTPAPSRGQVYVECRKFDKRLVVVRRVWEFYRARFDQRGNDRLEKVLKSADEIVWSCYAGSFQSADLERQTAPLPYIQPRYSPEAHTRVDPPPDLKSDVDLEFIKSFLVRLPIPTLGLPPACVEAPWWLIFIGHEVGHHIQYDLLPNLGLLEGFPRSLSAGASAAAEGQHDPKRWAKWNEEIFADVFSVLQMGPWAARAMAELEQADDAAMLSGGKGRYPIPLVRLALLSHLCDELKVKDDSARLPIDFEGMISSGSPPPPTHDQKNLPGEASNDLKAVPSVVNAALKQPLGAEGEASLMELFGWTGEEFQPHGQIESRKEMLLGHAPIEAEETLPAARLLISAAVAAWVEIAAIEDDRQREKTLATLKGNLLDLLPLSREEGTRAAVAERPAAAEDFGEEFAGLLLNAGADELGT